MKRNISFTSRYANLDLDVRSTCLYCGVAIDPKIIGTYYNQAEPRYCYLTLQCTNCDNVWADTYWDYTGRENFELQNKQLYKPTVSRISDSIQKLSPQGSRIYEQSLQAEVDGYDTLVGMGLRKALEFFLKDFLILTNPEEEDTIKSKLLGQVISDYIQEPTLLSLAKATSWLGNDETHYVRRHTDQDLQDLKKFLNATIHYLEYQLTILDAQDFVNQ